MNGELRAELARIFGPAGIDIGWRAMAESPARQVVEDMPQIFVIRFRGTCWSGGTPDSPATVREKPEGALAHTKMADGNVLPFGEVECDALRRYIGPAQEWFADENLRVGRALARLVAHELFHMLTRCPAHGRGGIAKPVYSRDELTAGSFLFARKEADWMRRWAGGRTLAAGD